MSMKTYLLQLWTDVNGVSHNFSIEVQMEDVVDDTWEVGEAIAKALAPNARYSYMEEKE